MNIVRKSISSWKWLLLLFLISLFIHGLIATTFGEFNVFHDELAHSQFARSLAAGDFIQFRGEPYWYSEFLYSVIISPVYAMIKDPFAAHSVILWVNSVMVASAVFPIYLTAQQLLKSHRRIWIVTIFGVVIADTMYATSVIQENLNYPLMMWFFYFFVRIVYSQRKTVLQMVGLGAVSMVLSIIKQMNLAVIIAIVLYYIYCIFLYRSEWKEYTRDLVCYLATYFVLRQIYMAIIDMLSTAEPRGGRIVQGLSTLTSIEAIITVSYAAIMYCVFTVLATGIFPLPVLVSNLHRMERKTRDLVVFAICYIVVYIGSICVLILPFENYGQLTLRCHTRYYFYIFVFVFLLFMQWYETSDKGKNQWISICALTGLAVILPSLNIIPVLGSMIDSISLQYLQIFGNNDVSPVVLKVGLTVIIAVGIMLLYQKKWRPFTTYTISMLFLLSGVSIVEDIALTKEHFIPSWESQLTAVKAANEYWEQNNLPVDDPDYLIILGVGSTLIDDAELESYLLPRYRYIQGDSLIQQWKSEGLIDFTTLPLLTIADYSINNQLEAPEYLLTKNKTLTLSGYEAVPLDLAEYTLYKRGSGPVNISQMASGIMSDMWVSSDAEITLASKDSECMYGTVTMEVSNLLFDENVPVTYTDGAGNTGTFYVPNQGEETSTVTVEVQKGANQLYELNLHSPNAMQPGNGDTRYLSFRIHSFELVSER